MTRRRLAWFLPEMPDLLGMLHAQFQATGDGMRDLAHWADTGGDPAAALAVRAAEHLSDDRKLDLRRALRTAFSTPVDSEDLYMISERLENVMNEAKDTVREAELMDVAPDRSAAALAALVTQGVDHLDVAVAHLLDDPDRATTEADAARKCQRRMEKIYRAAMSDLQDDEDLRSVTGRRELYRRLLRIGEHMVSVSERVWYAVVKES